MIVRNASINDKPELRQLTDGDDKNVENENLAVDLRRRGEASHRQRPVARHRGLGALVELREAGHLAVVLLLSLLLSLLLLLLLRRLLLRLLAERRDLSRTCLLYIQK